jgi:gamma-glutamyltranspeptidase/glutathione hydrolase
MVLKNGDLCMPFGTPSDDMQVQAMAQMFLSMVEFGLDPQQAVEVPRFRSNAYPNTSWPHSYEPGQLILEGHIGKDVGEALGKLGHKIQWWNGMSMATGDLCGILVDRERGVLLGGADPRWDSYTLGW